jgi:hypothetical protein
LDVSQSTISKDLDLIRQQYVQGIGERVTPSLQEYTDLSLAVHELIHNLWKIIDDSRTSPKLRLKAHSMMMEYYQLKAKILGERSRVNKEIDQVGESKRKEPNSGLKDESKTSIWTKRTLEKRLKQHAQIGYAADHFEMIDRIESVQSILFQKLRDESSKEAAEKNFIGICKLSSSILQNIQILRQLYLDAPFIARLKEELDKTRNELLKAKKNQVSKPFDGNDYSQVLTIDPDSIVGKPQESTPQEREADKPVF